MRTNQLLLIGIVVFAVGCGTPQAPASRPGAAEPPAVQLGGAPSAAGPLTAHAAEEDQFEPQLALRRAGGSEMAGVIPPLGQYVVRSFIPGQ